MLAAAAAIVAAVTVTVPHYPLVCGNPAGVLKVAFPAAVGLPHAIPASAVTLNGKPVASVTVSTHAVKIIPVKPQGVTCYSIVMGKLAIRFARSAHIAAGAARTATVLHDSATYAARITVSP